MKAAWAPGARFLQFGGKAAGAPGARFRQFGGKAAGAPGARFLQFGGKAAGAALLLVCLAVPAQADSNPSPARQARLKELVAEDCGACHGMTRKGGLGPPLLTDALAGISDEAVAATILDGRQGTPMPPWRGLLDDADASWIARYLKGETDVR